MTQLDNGEPITVHATPTTPQIEAGIRQAALAVGAILSTLGFTAYADKIGLIATLAPQIASLALVVGPLILGVAAYVGQWVTRRQAQKAATLTALLPDSVATFK